VEQAFQICARWYEKWFTGAAFKPFYECRCF